MKKPMWDSDGKRSEDWDAPPPPKKASKPRLKLWAVGTEDPDPDKWEPWNEVAIVVAYTKEEACLLNNKRDHRAVELHVSKMKPALLVWAGPYLEE